MDRRKSGSSVVFFNNTRIAVLPEPTAAAAVRCSAMQALSPLATWPWSLPDPRNHGQVDLGFRALIWRPQCYFTTCVSTVDTRGARILHFWQRGNEPVVGTDIDLPQGTFPE